MPEEHVNEKDSGIFPPHRGAIEKVVKAENAFLFVRPSEYDSTVLIGEGFATKNMDIHDKSSNWGPMAGMVPCDPYFSKKMEGEPNPAPHYHAHGAAFPVHLKLPKTLEMKFMTSGKMSKSVLQYKVTGLSVSRSNVSGLIDFYGGGVNTGAGDLVVTGRGPRGAADFVIKADRTVYWIQWRPGGKVGGALIPLWVWAYRVSGELKPVTGDYDMWMVAPHISAWTRHVNSELMEDPEGHGKSTASQFTKELVDVMNEECKKNAPTTCQVFNHGAEAQNYAFTQNLDPRLVMFTPRGTSRMVDSLQDLPQILGDLRNMGYLVLYNKRYGENDMRLMGKSTIRSVQKLETREKELGETETEEQQLELKKLKAVANVDRIWKFIARRQFERALRDLRELKQKEGVTKKQVAQAHWQLVRTAVKHGFESSRIARLYMDLREVMEAVTVKPVKLTDDDFPVGLKQLSTVGDQLLRSMQNSGIEATKGAGETDPEKFIEWVSQNSQTLEQFNSALNEFEETGALVQTK